MSSGIGRADLAGGGHYAFRLMKQQKIDQTVIEKKMRLNLLFQTNMWNNSFTFNRAKIF